MKTSEKTDQIMPAFVKAIGEITTVKKDSKNPFLHNKYASLDAIISVVRPVLAANKLAIFQAMSNEGIETFIFHESGQFISSELLAITPVQEKGISAAQALGVATTYAKRYQLASMLCISSEEDTDGEPNRKEGSDIKPNPDFGKEDARPWLSEKQLKSALDRIASGDSSVFQKTIDGFKMKKEYRKQLDEAMDNRMSIDIPSPTPESQEPEVKPKENLF